MRNIFILVSALLLGACRPTADVNATDPAYTGLAAIDTAAVRAHVEFLADDLMEGRASGTRGYDLAANYVAAEFTKLGLRPAGEDGSYFQDIAFRRTSLVEGSPALSLSRDGENRELVFEEDYLVFGDYVHEETDFSAEVVYVGFGITAPELDYDDYAGIDVEGKVVAYLIGAPEQFASDQRAFYSSSRGKAKLAVAKGAVGMIAFYHSRDWERRPWARSVAARKSPGLRWLDENGQPGHVYPELKVVAFLSPAGSQQLFTGAEYSRDDVFAAADEGRPMSFALPVSTDLQQRSLHEEVNSANVLAVLEGSDPKLKDEYVLYSAHLDHIGIGTPVDGDAIYNGAYDNATGIAIMLEVARVFSRLEQRPKRSILFAAVAAEEKGLLGSDYFANEPTVPMENITSNVNLDMPLLLYPLGDVIAFGAEHSSLEDVVRRAAGQVELELSPDPFPEEVIFIRSDQFSFVQKGVPAVFLVPGMQSADEEINGQEIYMHFLGTHYHQPSDDLDRDFNMESVYKFTAANFLIGLDLANTAVNPTWNEGDFFGEKYGRD